MSTKTKPYTESTSCREEAPKSRLRDCVPCDFPPVCRNNYYTGKLLTARDLTDEQQYFINKWRLHHLALHGWGIVCGLRIKPHPYCPDKRIILEPGLAIDGCGREIWIRKQVEILLPQPPEGSEVKDFCPPEPECKTNQHEEDRPPHGDPYQQAKQDSCPIPPSICPPTDNYYVCLTYAECETEFSPAPFDECVCTGNPEHPNRLCDGYKIVTELKAGEPDSWKKIRERETPCVDSCDDLWGAAARSCPEPGEPKCLPIAFIKDYRPGRSVDTSMIDNDTYRVLLPSTRTLEQVLRCVMEKIPTKTLTFIEDIGWAHNREYRCHEFMKCFVGEDGDQSKALEITFSGRVRPEGLTPQTFQAIAVRHQDKHKGGGFLELIPACVTVCEDTKGNLKYTKAYLHLDKSYVERCLRSVDFDLYITLRCNFVVDEAGNPVDGDFFARLEGGDYAVDPPTGNGIKGGTFESWIRVRA